MKNLQESNNFYSQVPNSTSFGESPTRESRYFDQDSFDSDSFESFEEQHQIYNQPLDSQLYDQGIF